MRDKSAELSEVIDNFRRTIQATNDYSKTAERSTGLTGPQLWALKILDNIAPIRVSDLARQMHLRPPTVVGILDRLEGKGLVTRNRSSEDRRVVVLHLTEMGKELAASAPEVAQIMLVKGLGQLSSSQISKVADGLKLIVRLLNAENVTPQPIHS